MNTSHPLNTTFIQKIERMAGGVLLAISSQLTSTQITKAGTDLVLDTNCENVWAKISYEGNKSLYLCTYYRPPSDKGESL
jgi:hypothetical protein